MVRQLVYSFLIEIADNILAIFYLNLPVAIFSQKLLQKFSGNLPGAVSVDALKRGIGLEIFHRREQLAQLLDGNFFVRH